MEKPKVEIQKHNGKLTVLIDGKDVSDKVLKVWFDEDTKGCGLSVATIQFLVDSVEVRNEFIINQHSN